MIPFSRGAAALLLSVATPMMARTAYAADAPAISLTVVNMEYEGSKMWLPGTLVVNLVATMPAAL